MKIAINATYNPDSGSKVQLINMLKYFANIDNMDIVIFIRKINTDLLQELDQKKIKIIISNIAEISTGVRVIWEQTVLPILLIKEKVDLYQKKIIVGVSVYNQGVSDITDKLILSESIGFNKICYFSYNSFDERDKQYNKIKYNYNKRKFFIKD